MRNKYYAKRTNGFSSKREANRAQELQILERIGEIKDLKYQVNFVLVPSDGAYKRPLSYTADFVYQENGLTIVEDCKGFKTPVYRLKKRITEALYPGVVIVEITR